MAGQRVQQRLWSLYSRYYDGLLDFVPYQRLLKLVVETVECGPTDQLVDLGCGTGNLLREIAVGAGPTVRLVGVDSSADMLRGARKKLDHVDRAQIIETDLLDWAAREPSGSVDRIVSVNVLYTLNAEQRARFWADSIRMLRPGGRLVVVTTDRAGFGPVLKEHLNERSVLQSLRPRLVAVLVLNLMIWALEARKVFDPAPLEALVNECRSAGGAVLRTERCYGGEEDGVDVMMIVEPASVDLRTEESVLLPRPDATHQANL